jgi:hypothetical protein
MQVLDLFLVALQTSLPYLANLGLATLAEALVQFHVSLPIQDPSYQVDL